MNLIFFDPYVGTRGKYSAEAIMRASAEGGYDGFNLPYDPIFMDQEKMAVAKIRSVSRSLNLKIHSFHPWGPSLTDPAVAEDAVERHYREALEVCRELAIDKVSVWPSYRGVAKSEAFQTLVGRLRKLVPLFGRERIAVLVEFQPGETPVENVDEALELVRQVSPELRISCDTTHLTNAEPDLGDAIRRLQPCLGDVHISGRHRKAPTIDPCAYETIFTALGEIGYDGPFLVQYHLEKDISTIGENGELVKRLIRQHMTGAREEPR